jgi:catechol 2,3-dioxygenase-like lactoylglutathione lyase family enzyme
MIHGICLGNVMVDCDDEQRLRDFYADLLGWEKCELYGHPAVRGGNGIVFLFVREDDYIAPVWPEQAGQQQKQMHFDFQVPDVAAAVRQAEAMGAVKARAQFGGADFVTMLDPAGHPFCLCAKD